MGLKNTTVQADGNLNKAKTVLDDVNSTIYEHDFLAILGGNSAGRLTLFNMTAETLMLTGGGTYILDKGVTHLPAEKHVNCLARVF